MAITINGSGTITGLNAGGLPSGVVTDATLASSLDLTGKTVTLPAGTGGKVLQVVRSQYDTATIVNASPTQNVHVDFPFSVDITPTSSTSLMLVSISIMGEIVSPWDAMGAFARTIGGVRTVVESSNSGSHTGIVAVPDSYGATNDSTTCCQIFIPNFPDFNRPANTNTITYTPTFSNANSSYHFRLNRTINTGTGVSNEFGISWITVMEVSA